MYMHNLCMHIHKHFVYLSVSFKSVEADGLSVCYCNSTFLPLPLHLKGRAQTQVSHYISYLCTQGQCSVAQTQF